MTTDLPRQPESPGTTRMTEYATPPTGNGSAAANLNSIPSGAPFLSTLANEFVHGRLIKGFSPFHDPALLPKATLYVPTRRAARVLAAEITLAMGSKASLLPTIRTLGDSDEDELFFQPPPADPTTLMEVIHPLERQVTLAKLVQGWTTQLSREALSLYGEEDMVIPSSMSDAIQLAQQLAALIDQLQTEEIPLSGIAGLMEEDYSQWWQLTLPFLKIVLDAWPKHLEDRERIDPADARKRLLDARTNLIGSAPPAGPVIAAGSTGSIPATARLLRAIARLPNGCVVLPGIDPFLMENHWHALAENDVAETRAGNETHPQFFMARLCAAIGMKPNDVTQIGESSADLQQRENLVSLALMTAAETKDWHRQVKSTDNADHRRGVSNITIINALNEREEALAIAIAMRECVEQPKKTAALVTPDRNLARRVASELQRYGIEVNDSGGTPLKNTQCLIFVRLCLESIVKAIATNTPLDRISFVSMAKHPFFRMGRSQKDAHRTGLMIENALVRGMTLPLIPGQLESAVRQARDFWQATKWAGSSIKRMTEEDWQALAEHCSRLDQVSNHIKKSFGKPFASIQELTHSAVDLLAELSVDENGYSLIEAAAGGQELLSVLNELACNSHIEFDLRPREFANSLFSLLGDRVIRATASTHPRLHILGPLEARLQHYDLIIMGSLTSTTWPQTQKNDPFLNRPMKAGLDMGSPERRIGLSAHDFQQLAGAKELVLSRSERLGTEPSIASRWLQRFETVAGEELTAEMTERGDRYLHFARELDRPAGKIEQIKRPNPKPPVELRPTALSVTDIEVWLRDPYALYARKILELQPMPDLAPEADARIRGTLFHDILDAFVRSDTKASGSMAKDQLLRLFDEHAAELNLAPEVQLIWRPGFGKVFDDYLAWEKERESRIARSHTEINGEIKVGKSGFRLRARADRIDRFKDGTVTLLDYKTGTGPSSDQALTLSPQLTLEGAILLNGGFSQVQGDQLTLLEYVRLRPDQFTTSPVPGNRPKIPNPPADAVEASQNALSNLADHVTAYLNPEQGYLSRYAVSSGQDFTGDYDHLARVREWSLDDDDDDASD